MWSEKIEDASSQGERAGDGSHSSSSTRSNNSTGSRSHHSRRSSDSTRSTTDSVSSSDSSISSKEDRRERDNDKKGMLFRYEQLGAPTVLYRHLPSYTSWTTEQTNNSNPPAIWSAKAKDTAAKNVASLSIGIPGNIDKNALFPPQPWGREKRDEKHAYDRHQAFTDAVELRKLLLRADRARLQKYFRHRYRFAVDSSMPSSDDYGSILFAPTPGRCHHKNTVTHPSGRATYCRLTPCFGGSNYCRIHYQMHRIKMGQKQGGTKIEPTSNNAKWGMLNHLPVKRFDVKRHQMIHDSSPYLGYNSSQIVENFRQGFTDSVPIMSHRAAFDYRRERMHSSPLQGYCAPFSFKALEYGLNPRPDIDMRTFNTFKMNAKRKLSFGWSSDVTSSNTETQVKTEIGHSDNDSAESDSSHSTSDERGKVTASSNGYSDSTKDRMKDVPMAIGYLKNKDEAAWINRNERCSSYKFDQFVHEEVEENPLYYGNCVAIIPCSCECCRTNVADDVESSDEDGIVAKVAKRPGQKSTDGSQISHVKTPSWFLLHPVHDNIVVSCLKLPNGNNRRDHSKNDPRLCGGSGIHDASIDIGGRVMQIASCFDLNRDYSSSDGSLMNDSRIFHFVCRTPKSCSFVKCIPGNIKMDKKGEDQSDVTSCSGVYNIEEIARIDLSNERDGVYNPIDVATNVGEESFLCDHSSFTILSRPSHKSQTPLQKNGTNILHHVTMLDDEPLIRKHQISMIESLSLIEYMNLHPMLLWGVGRSCSSNTLYSGVDTKFNPTMGYGHSLYTIDLRSDKASFMWSPSRDEFVQDGIHSISGILTNYNDLHTVYVSSFSAGGKMWQLDSRMPTQVVCAWRNPGLCENYSSSGSPSGVYGLGSLMTRPVSTQWSIGSNNPMPLLSVSKNDWYGINLYNEPLSKPRFHTRHLERTMSHGMDAWDAETLAIATSSAFRLPESSGGDFTCGLAAFYTPLKSIMNPDEMEKSICSEALCIVSATARGDLYAHTLLKCDGHSKTQARAFEGLPVGCAAIPVQDPSKKENPLDFNVSSDLPWTLSNSYPTSSQGILNHHVGTRSQCRPFHTVPLSNILRYERDESGEENDVGVTINHPRSETQFTRPDNQIPCSFSVPSSHLTGFRNLLKRKETTVDINDDRDRENDNLVPLDLSSGLINELKGRWKNDLPSEDTQEKR